MIVGIDTFLLYSSDAKRLSQFYTKTVGLDFQFAGEMGDNGDEIYMAHWKKGSDLAILDHSNIKGKNKQPERYMVNFEVENLEKEVARLKKAKVKLIADIYHVEEYGYIATFEDIDGNYFQLVQVRAPKK